jgi:fructose-bisphosphate aldolase class II
MFVGASLPLDQNIKQTKVIKNAAHDVGATCEAELGRVGGSESGIKEIESMLTNVAEVKQFVDETGVDALAIAVGNLHEAYKNAPNLQFKRLSEINSTVDTHLVLQVLQQNRKL